MKAVATALVLVVGAAVVLWYGNTLNSWVLGGFIGGLAALLLSVPISLLLFSYLSRRHDERQLAESQEELYISRVYEATGGLRENSKEEVEGYTLQEEDHYSMLRASRNLPAPSSQRLPATSKQLAGQRLASTPKQQTKSMPVVRGKESGRRGSGRRMNYPGFPGYEPGSSRSQYQSAALRAARMEAAQRDDDVEVLPTNVSRRPLSVRPQRTFPEQDHPSARSTRQFPPQAMNQPYRHRARRMVDSTPSQGSFSHALPAEGESSASHPEFETGSARNRSPQTGPVHPFTQSGSLGRSRQGEHHPSTEKSKGNLQRPLVRRAPYMYENDPLRQELAQQIKTDAPIVRRSSRLESSQDNEEDE